VPSGRLVWAHLPAAAVQATAAARRTAALGAPTVVAVTAPRCEAVDELLADLQARLVALYADEVAARDELRAILG
jgi:tRNA(Met) C34 N-acetyltransferase TmcA